jgi:hypothetical protein
MRKITTSLTVATALALGTVGFALSDAASGAPSSSGTPVIAHCDFAQLRVNLIAARQSVGSDRLALLDAALGMATSKGNTSRVDKIDRLIALVNSNQAKRSERLSAIEQACNVKPAAQLG